VGAIIEFDDEKGAGGFRVADDEVHVVIADLAEPKAFILRMLRTTDDVREADFAEDPVFPFDRMKERYPEGIFPFAQQARSTLIRRWPRRCALPPCASSWRLLIGILLLRRREGVKCKRGGGPADGRLAEGMLGDHV
jgi:hypothetical protein